MSDSNVTSPRVFVGHCSIDRPRRPAPTPRRGAKFPSAFLAAGSRLVVATLRSVADADAAAFARAYYEQPRELGPVVRVAVAQRALAHTEPVLAWASSADWSDADCDRP